MLPGGSASLLAKDTPPAPAEASAEVNSPPEVAPESDLPVPVLPSHFENFISHSPFVRTLNLSETLALRGIAEINGEMVATLYNRETKKSVLVTAKEANAERMQLMEINESADPFGVDLIGVSATIAVAGEEVELKFDPERIAPQPKNSHGKSHGGPSSSSSDSKEHKGPSPQDIERYKALPPEKQEKLREYIRQTMQRYPDMSREERGNMIRGAMTRLVDGGDISMPPPSSQGGSTTPSPTTQPSSSSSRDSSDRGRDRDRR